MTTSLTAQNVKDISGLYGECEIGFFACTQMYLKPNGIFNYFIFYDVGGGTVLEGQWQYKFDTIYLNTFKQPKQQKTFIINSETSNLDSLRIHVYDYDSLGMGFAEILINNNILVKCDQDGFAKISSLPVNNIVVHFITESFTFNIKDIYAKDISLFIPFQGSSIPEYLINEKWLYKKNKLLPFLRFEKKYDKKYSLPRTELINKRF